MKKRNFIFLSSAHALHALTSLMGCFLLPIELIRAMPHAPIMKPLIVIADCSGSSFPLLWAFASIGPWLLLLHRIYRFQGLVAFVRQGHLKNFQPPPPPDTPQTRLSASIVRLE